MPLRIIFMGTPDFSVATLRALAAAGHEIACVYTQPPRPAGRRGLELTPSPVQREAERLGVEVRTPLSLKGEAEQEAFRALAADVAVVVAYGLLLPPAILEGARLGCYNGHASLLPRWRGAAPIQRAIMAGDGQTGMMIMKMDQGLDTGPVALTSKVAIEPDMTAGELHDRLMASGAELMVDALARLEQGDLPLTPQAADGVTYASKIDKAETRIDWSRSAGEVHNHIRGLAPFPGAWCELTVGDKAERLKILRTTLERRASNWTHKGRSNTLIEHRNIPKTDSTFRSDALADGEGAPGEVLDDRLAVACGDGAVRLLQVQRAGGKAVSADEFLRGAKLDAGVKLT